MTSPPPVGSHGMPTAKSRLARRGPGRSRARARRAGGCRRRRRGAPDRESTRSPIATERLHMDSNVDS